MEIPHQIPEEKSSQFVQVQWESVSKLENILQQKDVNFLDGALDRISIDEHEKGELDIELSMKNCHIDDQGNNQFQGLKKDHGQGHEDDQCQGQENDQGHEDDQGQGHKDDQDQGHTSDDMTDKDDPIFNEIMDRVGKLLQSQVSETSLTSSSEEPDGQSVRVSDHFSSIPYGFQPRAAYDHGKKNSDIMGVSYNGRMRQFVILDAKGITTWNRSMVETKVTRAMCYPKYEYRMIIDLVYARKYNCYFALGKDFSLKVLNRDFEETCSVNADLRSVLFMVFNPTKDELITGGVGGTKIWIFHQVASVFQEIRPMANYRLTLKSELSDVGGSWVKRVELDQYLQHLYCCSDTDLYAYDLLGNLLFTFEKAHTMSITGCKYSVGARSLITTSLDTEVKVWSLLGGLIHTFRGHSRAVTEVIIHPDTSYLFITSSLDGTVRLWSLDTMEALYSLVVSVDGVLWMGLTDDKLLYLSTVHAISLWSLNQFFTFWSLARNKVRSLCLVGAPGKTTRVMAIGGDSSVRLFARGNQKNMSTVLPPPSLSPMQSVLSVSYNRGYSVVYVLISPTDIWVYTTRTDPACRVAVWNVRDLQTKYKNRGHAQMKVDSSPMSLMNRGSLAHRATEQGMGDELVTECSCVCVLSSPVMMWTEEGLCSPIQHTFLLLGMVDGRILFMDPVVKGYKYMEFKLSKDVVLFMKHDITHNCLLTTSKLKDIVTVQVWDLPRLQLQHEFLTTPDICLLTKLGSALFTGHTNGSVDRHTLVPTDDMGLYTTRGLWPEFIYKDIIHFGENLAPVKHAIPSLEDLLLIQRRPEHSGPILALDSCVPLNIVCSCSADGSVKIWDADKVMLTEISLGEPTSPVDEQLSAACFLNGKGDLLVAFKGHIFFLDHTRVCPSIQISEPEEDHFDKESDVLEEPAVLYDHGESDPVNMKNYLVPFNIDFSKDFLEGRLKVELLPEVIVDEEPEVDSESESEFSNAPTEIYLSPPDSPVNLCRIDLQMRSEVTKFDLEQQMVQTKKQFYGKGKRRGLRGQSRLTSRELLKEEKEAQLLNVELPSFGTSPGPSPIPSESTLSRPDTPSNMSISECEAESSDEEAKPEESTQSADQVAPPVSVKTEPPPKPGEVPVEESKNVTSKYGLSNIQLDFASLMKTKPPPPPQASLRKLDHSRIKTAAIHALPQHEEPVRPKREVKKKQSTGQRKLPAKGQQKRPTTPAEKLDQGSDTQKAESITDKDSAQELCLETRDPTRSRAVTPGLDDDRASSQLALGVGYSPTPYSVKNEASGRESRLSQFSSVSGAATQELHVNVSDLVPPLPAVPVPGDIQPSDPLIPKYVIAKPKTPIVLVRPKTSVQRPMTAAKAKTNQRRNQRSPSKRPSVFIAKEQNKNRTHSEDPIGKLLESKSTVPMSVETIDSLKSTPLTNSTPSDKNTYDKSPTGEIVRAQNTDADSLNRATPHDDSQSLDTQGYQQAASQSDSKNRAMPRGESRMLGDQVYHREEQAAKGSESYSIVDAKVNHDSWGLDKAAAGREAGKRDRRTDIADRLSPISPQTSPARIKIVIPSDPGQCDSDVESERRQTDMIAEEVSPSIGGDVFTPDGQWVGPHGAGGAMVAADQDWSMLSPQERSHFRMRPATAYTGAARVAAKMEGRQTDMFAEEVSPSIDGDALTEDGQWSGPHGAGGPMHTVDQDWSTLSLLERSRIRRRPASSYIGAARVAAKMEGEQLVPRRPRTAVETQDKDIFVERLNVANSLTDLQNMFEIALRRYKSHPGTPIEDEQWYKNMGNSFEGNWQDRMIERHHLLQLQKHVRAQSAAHRRRLLEQRQKVKRKSLLGHHNCDRTVTPLERYDSSLDILKKMERANSVVGHLTTADHPNKHRPHRRPKTAHPMLRGTPKQELSTEKPFRLRLSRSSTPSNELPKDRVCVRSYDPRNPKAVRPKSSKSIPSKCRHYLLVEQPKEPELMVASPMEEQLLAQRFPGYRNQGYPYPTSPMPPAEEPFRRQLSEKLIYSPFIQQIS